jgi:hypothetical protein
LDDDSDDLIVSWLEPNCFIRLFVEPCFHLDDQHHIVITEHYRHCHLVYKLNRVTYFIEVFEDRLSWVDVLFAHSQHYLTGLCLAFLDANPVSILLDVFTKVDQFRLDYKNGTVLKCN